MLNAFTVDVEDYYQVSGFEAGIPRSKWDEFPQRVVANTQRLLELLDAHDVKATFFVLGWVADRHPGLVRQIDQAGHEIGSHSYWHRLIYSQTPEEFRDDLRRSKRVLEDCIGRPIRAFRAPSFSITAKSKWALEVLVEEGIQCDSSIFPTRHDRYGMPGAKPVIHSLETRSGPLTEFPPTVWSRGRFVVPVAGGGYFRLYPYHLSRMLMRQVNGDGRPVMFYIHPWEIDPSQPRVAAGSALSRFRHYVGISSTFNKLSRTLQDFQFGRMSDVLARANLRAKPEPAQCQ